jgi:hypothetical protein
MWCLFFNSPEQAGDLSIVPTTFLRFWTYAFLRARWLEMSEFLMCPLKRFWKPHLGKINLNPFAKTFYQIY